MTDVGNSLLLSKQRPCYPLVQQHGQQRTGRALDKIQRRYTDDHEAGKIGDACVDGGTQGDDIFQRCAVKQGELGHKINSVEGCSEDRQTECAGQKADQRALFALFGVIDDHSGQHQSHTHNEVGQVADEGGAGAVDQELENDLERLADHGGRGSQIKTAEHHRQLGEVQLIKGRR